MGNSEQIQKLKLDQLVESGTNPRSIFDKAGLGELADSIRISGILQPILVRPQNGRFEVVVGARRFRAARLAALETVPAIVRELSDAEAMEIQLLENLQRQDLSPMEEALGYRALIDKAKYDVAKIAEKIGKSESYVYQRLKLAELTKPAQKALADGKINAGHAVQIARLQPEAQKRAIQETEGDEESGPMTVRELGSWIQTEIHRNLDVAPWKKDDISLLPKAGACSSCPKRAGTNPTLFPELRPMTCTDGACYQAKIQAFIALRLKEIPGALKILVGGRYDFREAAREMKDLILMSEYGEPGWKPSATEACKFTKDAIVVLGQASVLGQHRFVCAEPACPVHGTRRSASGSVPKAPGAMNEERRKQVEELWHRRERQALKLALHAALRKKQEKLTVMPVEALRFAVLNAFHSAQIYSDALEYFEKTWGVKDGRINIGLAGSDKIPIKADQITLLRLLLDFPLVKDIANKFGDGKEIAFVARAYKLPIPAITAAVRKEWAEKKRVSYAKRDARLAAERATVAVEKDPAPNAVIKNGEATAGVEFLKLADEVCGASSISEHGRLPGTVNFAGRSWACVGTVSSGNEGIIVVKLVEVKPRAEWKGRTFKYADKQRGSEHFYGGIVVKCKGKELVLMANEITVKREETETPHRKARPLLTNAKKPAIKKVRKTRKPKAQKRGKKR